MNRIILLLLFTPIFSYAQDKNLKGIIPGSSDLSKKIIICCKCPIKNQKSFFIAGKQVENDILYKLNPNEIESITVISDDKKFPNGRVDIVLKNEKK